MAKACVKKAEVKANARVIFKSEFIERSKGSCLNSMVAKPGSNPIQLEKRINKKNVITIGKNTLAFWLPAKSSTVVYPKSTIISNKLCNPEGTSWTFLVDKNATIVSIMITIQLTSRVLVIGKPLKYPKISGCKTIACSMFNLVYCTGNFPCTSTRSNFKEVCSGQRSILIGYLNLSFPKYLTS